MVAFRSPVSAVSDRLVTTLLIPSASWPQKTQDIGQKQICPDWCREEGDCRLGLSGGSGEEVMQESRSRTLQLRTEEPLWGTSA